MTQAPSLRPPVDVCAAVTTACLVANQDKQLALAPAIAEVMVNELQGLLGTLVHQEHDRPLVQGAVDNCSTHSSSAVAGWGEAGLEAQMAAHVFGCDIHVCCGVC